MRMMEGPSWTSILGTDNLGRDLLGRVSRAITGSVIPVWLGSLLATLSGFAIGIGFIRLAKNNYISVFLTILSILLAIPAVVLMLGLSAIMEQNQPAYIFGILFVLILIRSMFHLINLYQRDCQLEYWQANRILGGTEFQRCYRYGICGSWLLDLLSVAVFHCNISFVIESSMSYLGLGIQEPMVSFGNILASHFDTYLRGEFRILFVVITTMTLVCYTMNIVKNLFLSYFLRKKLSDNRWAGTTSHSANIRRYVEI